MRFYIKHRCQDNIDIYSEDKDINYTYDKAGNITINNEVSYEYAYDAHGRLTKEKDYVDSRYYRYDYNETGNIQGKTIYELDKDGNKISSGKKTVKSEYDNEQWPDQLTSYDGETITYEQSGKPTDYIDGLHFTWSRGRQLAGITFEDDSQAAYRYNENGLRTYKDTADAITTYEWDDRTLIRETVTYKATNKTYDIWYFYDSIGSAVGYEYSYINNQNKKSSMRIYYEKHLQGNVIGLLDSRGIEIATYAYDAWGNITKTVCYEGYDTAYDLNHITYKGYYRDEETGFYYLQSRYYDPEICRFVNEDDVNVIGIVTANIYNDNIYIYCNNEPVSNIDYNGYLSLKRAWYWAKGIFMITTGLIAIVKMGEKGLVAAGTSSFIANKIIAFCGLGLSSSAVQQWWLVIGFVAGIIGMIWHIKKHCLIFH